MNSRIGLWFAMNMQGLQDRILYLKIKCAYCLHNVNGKISFYISMFGFLCVFTTDARNEKEVCQDDGCRTTFG